MQVKLINFTGMGTPDPSRAAANLMIFTKQTRLEMNPDLIEQIEAWPQSRIDEELAYMANTIPSSWEFCDYTFLITDVTRAFTHQFVRTRQGSYAQQTMRVLDKKGWTYLTGPSIEDDEEWTGVEHGGMREYCPGQYKQLYHDTMATIAAAYDEMVEGGIKIEDARGVLPTNIHTNIVAKFNLRTLAEMFRKRASGRTQGEYRDVIEAMKAEVVRVHSWAPMFIDRNFDKAAAELESGLRALSASGKSLDADSLTHLVKLIDQMRMMA